MYREMVPLAQELTKEEEKSGRGWEFWGGGGGFGIGD